ncbi:hypothetical protein SAY86_018958 [Trapa natans]|uniref:dihydroneopterin aldolase n=1 Tax=Trapa natans TaxID=22666 RepID=A0AAN7LFY5_TRANT|nr:hypothetical protein SAY86_018958 [Trapa natans]
MSMEKAIPTRPAGQSRAAVISISDDGKNLQAEPLILREGGYHIHTQPPISFLLQKPSFPSVRLRRRAGTKEEERKLGQKFLMDIDTCHHSLAEEGCFMKLTWEGILEEPPHYLLESVAEHFSSTTMSKFPQILDIRLKVGKPHVAVPCPLDYLGVEITRQQRSSC